MAGEAFSNPLIENNSSSNPPPPPLKKKRNLPGTPDPEAEVIALSPKTLLATNRFLCEVCGKGFQREQNLQLHRRGHNLPWKLRQRATKEPRKRVYVCPEKSCVHHHPSRALGDLTGVKKHFCRKHGEKKWKCEKCEKHYAVQSDWKAHSKTCGTREYRCDCGSIFSRRDSFVTHKAFCDVLAEETARVAAANMGSFCIGNFNFMVQNLPSVLKPTMAGSEVVNPARPGLSLWMNQGPRDRQTISKNNDHLSAKQIEPHSIPDLHGNPVASFSNVQQLDSQLSWMYRNKLASPGAGELTSSITFPMNSMKECENPHSLPVSVPSLYGTRHHYQQMEMVAAPDMSATGLLQKAAQIGATASCSTLFGSFDQMKCPNGLLDVNNSGLAIDTGSNMEKAAVGLTLPETLSAMYSVRHQVQKDDGRGGETRDFLGVDAPTICTASSLNGWI